MKRKQQNKKGNKKKRSSKPQLNQQLYKSLGRDQLVVPRRYRILTPSLVTELVFMSTLHSPLNNAGLSYASARFRPSSAFDVDPIIGGTSMPGFNELAGIYGRYRMLKFKLDLIAINNEEFPVNVVAFVTNFDPGANYAQVQSQYGNSFARSKFLSPKGGMDRASIHTPWWSAAEITGSDTALVDDSYSSTIATSPTNNTYISIGLWTGNNTALVNGVSIQCVITAQYRFSEVFHLVTHPDPPHLHPELYTQMLPGTRIPGKIK